MRNPSLTQHCISNRTVFRQGGQTWEELNLEVVCEEIKYKCICTGLRQNALCLNALGGTIQETLNAAKESTWPVRKKMELVGNYCQPKWEGLSHHCQLESETEEFTPREAFLLPTLGLTKKIPLWSSGRIVWKAWSFKAGHGFVGACKTTSSKGSFPRPLASSSLG